MDEANCVIYVGTYSKCFLPGLRLGWIACPSDLARTLVYAKIGADYGDSYFLQALMHEFIRHGYLARHIRSANTEYRKRRDLMCRLLSKHLPPGCSFRKPEGGMYIWLQLPGQLKSMPLLRRARAAGVAFLPAAYCKPDRMDDSALLLSFSRVKTEEIESGIPLLCQVMAECLDNPKLLEVG
jgi:2-aminoadipate transaminase